MKQVYYEPSKRSRTQHVFARTKGESEEELDDAVFVSHNGVLYSRGTVYYLAKGTGADKTLIFREESSVTSEVSGETLDLQNP